MKDDKALIATALAQQAHHSPEFKKLANKGLIDFLREQIVDAEWKIARARAEIEAYEGAIAAIEKRDASPNSDEKPATSNPPDYWDRRSAT